MRHKGELHTVPSAEGADACGADACDVYDACGACDVVAPEWTPPKDPEDDVADVFLRLDA